MNYALIFAVDRSSNLNSFSALLGKPMVFYMIDELKKVSLKPFCIINCKEDNTKIQDNFIYEKKDFFTFGKKIFEEDGVTVLLQGNKPLVDKEVIQTLLDYHIFNQNDFTIGTIISDKTNGCSRIIKKENKFSKIIKDENIKEEEKFIKEIDAELYCINNKILMRFFSDIKWLEHLFDSIKILKRLNYKIDTLLIKDAYKLESVNTYPELNNLEEKLRKVIIEKHISNNVYIENSNTITIGPDVCLEPNCKVRSGSIILGKSIVKTNAIVGPNSEVIDSFIGECSIVSHSVVVQSTVGKKANIGPFAHLRMHAYIGDNDRVGNFVEIKNSTIGEKTNISHLTYVGDTECGKGVNFGCGVVTVNYNGKNKFKTKIGNNVFIGCNSNLIAPIQIKSGSFIAAGSTITENMEEDDFSISRIKQVIKQGYAKKYNYKRYFETDDSNS